MSISTDYNQAISHHQAGQFAEAESIYRNILAIDPKHAGALMHLGLIAHQMGHGDTALELIDRAVTAKPKFAEAHYNRGTVLHAKGQLKEAADSFRSAAKIDKNHIAALYNLAGIQHLLGQTDKAIKNFQNAAKKAPDQPEILINLAVIFYEQQRLDEGLRAIEKAIKIAPLSTDAQFTRGNILSEMGLTEEAISCYDTILAENANNTLVLINKAAALQESDHPADALPIYDKIINLLPNESEPYSNKANVLGKLGQFEAAFEAFAQARNLKPDDPYAAYNEALLFLLLGRFKEGLPGFEHRLEGEEYLEHWDTENLPLWQGEKLSGPLYIRAEQGVGDHLLWSTQIPSLLERGLDVIFECDPRLASLISRSFPAIQVISEGRNIAAPNADARQIGMASLPYRLGDWPEIYDPQQRILTPNRDLTAKWREEIAKTAAGRPVIGISWRSARRKVGPHKSLPLDYWQPILNNREALFVNLQYGDTDEEITKIMTECGVEILTLPKFDRMNDLDDFAAIVDLLDLVITTSNVTAHFAGGLGKPCWLALQKVPLWYWGHAGEARQFYKSITAYRQKNLNDWSNVIAELTQDLTNYLK